MTQNSAIAKFQQRVKAVLSPEFVERDRTFQFTLGAIDRNHAARGLLQSSVTLHAYDSEAAQELRVRATRLLGAFSDIAAVQRLELTSEAINVLKPWCESLIQDSYSLLRGTIQERTSRFGLQREFQAAEIDFARENVAQKVSAGIDLLVDRAEASTRDLAVASAPILHFHSSTIGSVQTGAASVANVTMSLTTSDRATIETALIAIHELVAASAIPHAAQLQEVVEDGHKELKREAPNTLRLKTILQSLSDGIQGIAGAPAVLQLAYDATTLLSSL